MTSKLISISISVLLLILVKLSCSSNILFFIAYGGESHHISAVPIANALADRGHNVTFLTKYRPKEKSPKYNVYIPKVMSEYFLENLASIDFFKLRQIGGLTGNIRKTFIQSNFVKICEKLYIDPEFKEFVKSNKFDLVIMDALFNECGYGVAYAHGAKTIICSTSTLLPWLHESLGIPDEASTIPDPSLPFPKERSFLERVLSTLSPIYYGLMRQYYYLPALEKITKEGLGDENFPRYSDLERNTSLVLLNIHVAQDYPKALPPNVIPIGGMTWVEKSRRDPLPKHMEDHINAGKEGFVYISFGSFLNFFSFPKEIQQNFINALLKFPNIQFIWKLNKTPENLPKNILVEKWLPQQDLLLHPKIRAFITHSGLGGVTEAIYSSVPMICFPIFAEQDYNAFLMEQKGVGIKMEITTLTEEDMEKALNDILTNDSYRENMKKLTKRFVDRPMKPIDTILWWIEYILRQEGTDHLRPLSLDVPWWKKRNLDVWLFLWTSVIVSNLLGLYLTYKLVRRCFGRSGKDSKNLRKQKKK